MQRMSIASSQMQVDATLQREPEQFQISTPTEDRNQNNMLVEQLQQQLAAERQQAKAEREQMQAMMAMMQDQIATLASRTSLQRVSE